MAGFIEQVGLALAAASEKHRVAGLAMVEAAESMRACAELLAEAARELERPIRVEVGGGDA